MRDSEHVSIEEQCRLNLTGVDRHSYVASWSWRGYSCAQQFMTRWAVEVGEVSGLSARVSSVRAADRELLS